MIDRKVAILGVATVFVGVLFLGAWRWCAAPAPTVFPGEEVGSSPGSEKSLSELGSSPPLPSHLGSVGCRSCHEDFYRKWASSHHGLAMQPFTPAFATANLSPTDQEFRIGGESFTPVLSPEGGLIREKKPDGGAVDLPIVHVLGGKNVYYFLTPWERGRLQVLPLAYDVRSKRWFDVPASGVRHFADRSDASLDWRHSAFTFNTSCYRCHVSQLSLNYDSKTDVYHTIWGEPGINCETCHGPGVDHVRACEAAPLGQKPQNLHILSMKQFSPQQLNDSCAPCHAKMSPVTATFTPGDRYFDHFDLVAMEDPDFYPDGRDLGENYTLSSWHMSSCVRSGSLSCTHCHTSSGRFKFSEGDSNRACLPCHQDKVKDPTSHTFHKTESTGSRCISCHMPSTMFAAMRRTDHSMRPPMPAATMAFQSPNACNLCHTDKEPGWAESLVRQWRKRDYQGPTLHWARLIGAARKHEWTQLPNMIAEIRKPQCDPMVATSLLRLLQGCEDPRRLDAATSAIRAQLPLVRAAAVELLGAAHSPEAIGLLLQACQDDVRLVRVRAAAALLNSASLPATGIDLKQVRRAADEYFESMEARPDHWSSHYNLGNYLLASGDAVSAAAAFEKAIQLESQVVMPYVNASIAYAQLGRRSDAERLLRKAVQLYPESAPAQVNLGMLLAEEGHTAEAESAFRAALKSEPSSSIAAYNLAVLLSRDRLEEAIRWARVAYEGNRTAKYGSTLAFYLQQAGKKGEAVTVLKDVVQKEPSFVDAYLVLGKLLESQGDPAEALKIYREAIRIEGAAEEVKQVLNRRIQTLQAADKDKPK